jgi:hypothetical protein
MERSAPVLDGAGPDLLRSELLATSCPADRAGEAEEFIRGHDPYAMRQPKTRLMYIESKSGTLNGPARIGRVMFSKAGKSLTYRGRTFQSLKGQGFKANYFDIETGEEFWISGPRKDGKDRLYPESTRLIEIDDDVAEEYWRDVRGQERAPTT